MGNSPTSVLSAPPVEHLGREVPRLWSPPLRALTPKTSAGFEAATFAEEVLGITLLPWQRWLLIHALELLEDRTYRYRTVVLLVARQSGKSTVLQILALWRMFVDQAPLVIGTAQNLDVAEEQWQAVVDLAEGTPELAGEIATVTRVNGKKSLRLVSGERYKVAAASRKGGRGLAGDLVILDELREHQNWDSWAAVTKTTMARARAQIWCASNAGARTSVVLTFLRRAAHAALGNPDGLDLSDLTAPVEEAGDSLGIFEWSAPPGCDPGDRGAWCQANPALGYLVTERAIASAARTDPDAVFRTEVLCQWVDVVAEAVIPPDLWAARGEPARIVTATGYALDVSEDGAWTAIAYSDGRHVKVVENRPGTNWVLDALTPRAATVGEVALDASGPAGALVGPLERAGLGVRRVKPQEYAQACGEFYAAVIDGGLTHADQGELNTAVRWADRTPAGDGAWKWSRKKSTVDISPLVAVTLARWAAGSNDDGPSVYETRGLALL